MRLTSVALLLLCLAGGWALDHLYLSGHINRLENARLQEQKDAATAWGLAWKHAKEAGDAAEIRLAASESMRKKTLEEKTREIARLSNGHACLSGSAVRLLNNPGPRLAAVPETAGQPAGAAGAFATDADVGAWIAVAQERYEQCRERVDALIGWWHD